MPVKREVPPTPRQAATELQQVIWAICAQVDRPIAVQDPVYPRWRFAEHTDRLFCLLKAVKYLSTLFGAITLDEHGHVQEVGILARVMDDCQNDIFFMLTPMADGKPLDDQIRLIEDFFQEEFEDPTRVWSSEQKRDNVPRRKIHAGFAKVNAGEINPSDGKRVFEKISKVLSGYVHGAYPHIMETYGGIPPRFHMSGMKGTTLEAQFWQQILTYTYRCIMAVELVALRFGRAAEAKRTHELLERFEPAHKMKPTVSAEAQIKKMKAKEKEQPN